MSTAIALVGDFKPDALAHQAIPIALALAGQVEQRAVSWEWVPTAAIRQPARDLARFSGIWVTPASPYASMAGALAAIRWARETRRPIFGSCGGFQHMLIEFARDVAGLALFGGLTLLTFGLGVWQAQRYFWKVAVVAERAERLFGL